MRWRRYGSMLGVGLAILLAGSISAQGDQWPRFRGPNGAGVSAQQGLPVHWTEDDFEWVVDLDGKGHSSPVIWDQLLFLTSGRDDGTRTVQCLDALTGGPRWKDSIRLTASHLHAKNSYASGTPATDGERVYVPFADDDRYLILAYSLDGEKLWTRDLGPFVSQHGFGISPVVYRDLLIVANDQRGPSSIQALDVKTGKTRWRPERPESAASYSTPLILNLHGRDQVITLSGPVGLAGFDPLTGRQLWASGRLPERTVASPVFGNGQLIASCGVGGRGKLMVAVDPGGDGTAKTIGERSQVLPYVPTPVIDGNYLYFMTDDGIACCVDLNGDLSANVWRKRIGHNYSSSPIIVDGKIYTVSEDGQVSVIDASPEFHDYGFSPLGDESYATPAVANGRLYLRGFHRVVCLKATTRAATLSE